MRTATVFNFLVESTLIGSFMILVVLAARVPLRRTLGSRCIMAMWLLVALRLLLPIALPNPLMNWLKPTLSADGGIRPIADQVRVRVGDAAHALYWKTFSSSSGNSVLRSLLWRAVYATRNGLFSRIAFGVYVSGALLILCWNAGRTILFRQSVRRGWKADLPEAYHPLLQTLCQRYGIRRLPRVWMVAQIPGSSTFRLFRPMIILPESALADDIPAMLEREICSIRRHDPLWAMLRNLCCVVHWFNPLVWLGAWLTRADQCLATDACAIRGMDGDARRRYAQPLIHTNETHHARPSLMVAATPITLRDRQMSLRIRGILHPTKPRRKQQIVFGVCCCLVLFGMFATAEQSSLANLPTLTTPALRQTAIALSTPEEAQAYAAAFLALEGIEADDGFIEPTLTKTADGWSAEWYVPGAQMSSQLTFSESGAILGYISGEVLPDHLQPLSRPITTHNGEGQQWCAFLSSLIEIHMPELWQEYDAMEIVSSGRQDGMQYITVTLIGVEGESNWQAVIQVSPSGRLISLLPIVG